MNTKRYALLLLLLLLTATAVSASPTPPVSVRMVGPLRCAEPGEPFHGSVVLTVEPDQELTDLRLEGLGWTVTPSGDWSDVRTTANERLVLEFTAVSANPEQALTLSWTRLDRTESRRIDLSRETRDARLRESHALVAPRDAAISLDTERPPADRYPDVRADEAVTSTVDPAAKATGVQFTAEGVFQYLYYPTGEFVNPEGLSVKVVVRNGITSLDWYTELNQFGQFSVECWWPWESGFETYAVVKAKNEAVTVEDATWEDDWSVLSPIYPGPADGSTFDFGVILPMTERLNQCFHLAETTRRGAQMYQYVMFVGMSYTEIQFPDSEGDTAFYTPYWGEIHMRAADGWAENTLLHEYGHHFHNNADFHRPDYSYCNGNCDDDVLRDDCSHCDWCMEEPNAAWNEAWAQYLSRVATDYIDRSYAVPSSIHHMGVDALQATQYSDCIGGAPIPEMVENYIAAAMWDLTDYADYGETNDIYQGYADVVGHLAYELWQAAETTSPSLGRWPHTPVELFRVLCENEPGQAEAICETVALNGFFLDDTPPGVVTFTAEWPVLNQPSPDNTIWVSWDPAPDDLSGIRGYAATVWPDAPQMPILNENVGDVDNIEFDGVDPGTYYVCMRARDRALNWSNDWVSIGPFIVEEADPTDLERHTPTGWQYPLVVRNDAGASFSSAVVSTYLDGAVPNTYWSYGVVNDGDVACPSSTAALYVDGDTVAVDPLSGLGGGMSTFEVNLGPITVNGGRHAVGIHLDSEEMIAETHEYDNHWAGQWAWTGAPLAAGAIETEPAPAAAYGGLDHVSFEMPVTYNCEGFILGRSLFFHGAFMYPVDQSSDFDLRLFGDLHTPEGGYFTPLANSSRPGGCLEAVLTFGLNAGITEDFTVGATSWDFSGGEFSDSDYVIGRTSEQMLSYGTVASSLNAARMMEVYTVQVDASSGGFITFALETQDDLPMHLAFFDETFTTGGLLDADATATAPDAGTTARISVQVPVGEYCAVVVWRDPVGPLALSHNYYLTYAVAETDPAADAPDGWVDAVVPHIDGAFDPNDAVPSPTRLVGWQDSTYVYTGEINLGLATCPNHEIDYRVDGRSIASATPFNFMAAGWEKRFVSTVLQVPGGRHVLSARLDPDSLLTQESYANDTSGRQWVWEPKVLGMGSTEFADPPQPKMAGHDEANGSPLYYNCDGYNTGMLDPYFGRYGLVTLAGEADSTEDVDLRLYEPSGGADNGFAFYEKASSMPAGETDFILIDLDSGSAEYDIGVLNAGDAVNEIVLSVDVSGGGFSPTPGVHGPFTHYGNSLQNMWEITMPRGIWLLTLSAPGAGPDLGFAAVAGGPRLTSRIEIPDDAVSWLASPGEDEVISVEVTASSQAFCLVVWRQSTEFLGDDVTYTITVEDATTVDVAPDAPPVLTRLLAPTPNPFNPSTTIAFDLAISGRVDLAVYDVAGRRVRTLIAEELRTGRHEATWQGRDDSGRYVAAGSYICRLKTGTTKSTRRLTLVK